MRALNIAIYISRIIRNNSEFAIFIRNVYLNIAVTIGDIVENVNHIIKKSKTQKT